MSFRPYYVYVIEIRDSWGRKKFYVGSSALTPRERLGQHQRGKAYCGGCRKRSYAAPGRSRAIRLRWELFSQYNPLSSRQEALAVEKWLRRKLKSRGYEIVGKGN